MVDQSEIFAFFQDPRSHDPVPPKVEVIETHGAWVFLAGDDVYKIKRAVKFPYMDFSSLEKRKKACFREIEVNRPQAPEIYIGVVPVTLLRNGGLKLGGSGEPVEWAVHMRRFDSATLLDRIAERGELNTDLAGRLAELIADFHLQAPVHKDYDGREAITLTRAGILESLSEAGSIIAPSDLETFSARSAGQITKHSVLMKQRSRQQFVRRCHGDLHLQNIVLIDDRPVLFDAIEFDERLATIDLLYDLAFLLMDLGHRVLTHEANTVLNRYYYRQNLDEQLKGLALLPLFLSLRAAVRAMVTIHRYQSTGSMEPEPASHIAKQYFSAALDYLSPPPPRLIAIGGLSGTGKTTLAASLAPTIGARPGALHLRSDLERKALFNAGETTRLGPEGYTPVVTKQVYETINHKARLALEAGHSVIVDAVFARANEKQAVQKIAANTGVPFTGLWLSAPVEMLKSRVRDRRNDASDATAEIVELQTHYKTGPHGWRTINAGSSPEQTLHNASRAVGDME